jgi:Domain of unknown function (DUF3472)
MRPAVTIALVAATWLAVSTLNQPATAADKRLEGIACRSVHLSYVGVPGGVAFHNEVNVETTAEGTYFCVCGFSRGYYGIQELANGKRSLIFSVWDPGKQNDPNSVDPAKRVQLLYKHEAVRVGRFGNEGTGGQSFLDFDWQTGKTLRLMVAARRIKHRMEYAAFFFNPTNKAWLHLVTFSTLTDDTELRGYYAFIEDFRRNRVSATKTRRATFPTGWVMTDDRKWHALNQARFTADSNPVLNINAGVSNGQFYLATGGKTANDDVQLKSVMERDTTGTAAPTDAAEILAKWLNAAPDRRKKD